MHIRKLFATSICAAIVLGVGYLAIRSYTRSSYANRAQNLFVLLQAGDYDKAEGEFLNRGFCKTLEKEWRRLNTELGPFRKSTVLQAGPANDGANKYRVDLVCDFGETGKRYVIVKYFTNDGISSFLMGPKPMR